MKMHIKLFLTLLVLISFSCKDDKRSKETIENIKEEKEDIIYSDNFSITLNAKVSENDRFQIFYRQESSGYYNETESVTIRVAPDPEFQKIEIKLPDNVYPYNFRLDLGYNKVQESIQMKSLILKYKKRSYKIEGNEIPKYFTLNEGVEVESDSITFLLKTHNQDSKIVYDPFIIGKPILNDVIYTKL